MNVFRRVLYAFLGVGSIVVTFMCAGFAAASTHHLKYWSYPTYFGAGMLLAGLVFLVVRPAEPGAATTRFRWLGRIFTLDEKKLERGIWPWVRKRGPFALVLVAAIVFGPFFAALVIRFLGLSEQKAWLYAFITTLIAVGLWVSVYLGVVGAIVSALAVNVPG